MTQPNHQAWSTSKCPQEKPVSINHCEVVKYPDRLLTLFFNPSFHQRIQYTAIKLRCVLSAEGDFLCQVVGHQFHHISISAGIEQRLVEEVCLLEAGILCVFSVDEKLEMQSYQKSVWTQRSRKCSLTAVSASLNAIIGISVFTSLCAPDDEPCQVAV